MSQAVVSRPGTQSSKVGVLPRIEHPLSRLENPEKISIRGMSRASNRSGEVPARKTHRFSKTEEMSPRRKDLSPKMPIEAIPEGVQVVHSRDPSKPTLPIFGNRAVLSRAESRVSNASKLSSLSRPGTQTRIEIDELEMLLRDKIRSGGFFTIRQSFKNNDPEGKGNVTREALMHIISSTLGRLITSKQFHLLLKRLHLAEQSIIKFEEFYSQFRESVSSEYPRWLDPVARAQTERASMNASQVHAQLKERAKQRFLDLADLVPQMNPGGSGRIMAPEFRNVLNKLGFYMDDAEFDKLWKKYDTSSLGVVNAENLLKKLGIEFRESRSPPSSTIASINGKIPNGKSISLQSAPPSGRSLRPSEAERRTSIDIERWLKDKFREGFKAMRREFKKGDNKNTGKVSREVFRRVLAQFDLYLREDSSLNMFLARCGLSDRGDISYVNFLNKFQDRSEEGMAHNILSNSKHRFNQDPRPVSPKSTVTAVEAKMMTLFQSDFLALLGMFHKIDKHHQDLISQQEFRAAIESRFGLEMDDEEFEIFMEQVPLDAEGNVRYPDFMAQFDTKKGAKSLWDGKSVVTNVKNDITKPKPTNQQRTLEDLHAILRDFVKNDMNKLESEFRQLDEFNSGRLTQEMMFQLLSNLNITPKVTRGEIRRLWETFIVNKNRTLSFLQFVRHYGYSLKSAAFPNAKIAPPQRGDNDFMIRSRKLNCAADMLEDSLRAKVDYLWEDLRREFVEMDPYHTGFVSRDEFRDVLMELCVHLSNHETDLITNKFDTNGDGRISYVEFLRPFAQRRQLWKDGNNMLAVLTHPQPELPGADIAGKPTKGLEAVTSKLKQQLAGDWRTLRRAFKKMDVSSDGMLTLPEFRSVLKLCNVVLDEDEVYHVLSKYDQSMSGKLNYKKFLQENTSRATSRNSKP
ncbi:EF-hand calcium-binding domain-containing protein 6-like isoform X2 [Clavelina lepadiformis]|uniref:EF-hand calcium-binding domain-containing protein 6-like isoform X2 n=1 Tax=Clavelina lepadiformis TaxID=159417 RepID=UPI004041DF34